MSQPMMFTYPRINRGGVNEVATDFPAYAADIG
jgi:hypothetical protein